ncbi:MAG TPA: LPS export ABC transporter periplasmic protein LptC [Candidatus Polarisedimenticolia bacterium]|nr:LPS export ABC transporter periplasmic protein LptC [Candidatus Polarisedimenticolia bacterium]
MARRMASWIPAALLMVALGAGCQSKNAPAPGASNLQMPDQEARDFTLTETSEGVKNWTLWASYAAMYNAKNLVDAKPIRIEFFDSKGKLYSKLTADQGLVDQRTNNLEAIGKVRIVTETGVHMETDSLRWINASQKIVSESFVKVTRNEDVVTGYGFESDPNLDHFHLKHEVRAEVRDTGGGDSL